ncbi:MAG: DUF3891 family protein [Solirubrobacteraceae bacterium]
MLVTRRGGKLELITQPDHAAVAGALAARWGNRAFSTPAAREALLCAAVHHDDGWLELDTRPAYNATARRPAHFTEVPLTESVGPYGRGVESVYARDPLAGALCSMHWSGFSTSRWGAGGANPAQDPLALEVVASQEARWMPALREAWGNRGRRSEFDAQTWHAYEVLQAVDLISLGLGLIDTDAPAPADGGETVPVAATLRTLDQEPGPRTVASVPLAAGGDVVTLTLIPRGPARVELNPYPLAGTEAAIEIPLRRLADRAYESPEEAAAAYHEAMPETRQVTVVPPGH